jgi:mRNA-degrading endonuclease RelE of RelBE toxin-antitoxin system
MPPAPASVGGTVRARRTSRFDRDLATAPLAVQRAFEKQLTFLLENLRHPSLQAKKYDEARGIWQARVTRSWRFYFTIEDDIYTLRTIRAHPK